MNTNPTEPVAALKLAMRLQANGHWNEAAEQVRQVLAQHQQHPGALHLLAVLHAQQRQFQEAEPLFALAAQVATQPADVLANWANALWESGNLEQCELRCQQALALVPGHAAALNVWGNALLSRHQAPRAAEVFQRLLANHPNHVQALNNLGNALQHTQSWTEAAQAYRQAVALAPGYADAWVNLGQALRSAGDMRGAHDAYAQGVRVQPGSRVARWGLCEVSSAWVEPLESNRLQLARFVEADADFLAACHANGPFLYRYNAQMPRHLSAADWAAKVRQSGPLHPRQVGSVDWVVHQRATGQRVGLANLVDIDWGQQRAECLIGIPFENDQKGRVFAEASLLVLDFSFNLAKLHKLTALVYGHNSAAMKNIEHLGFVPESRLREHMWSHDDRCFMDLHGYGMTEHDFRSNTRLARLSLRLLGRDITQLPL